MNDTHTPGSDEAPAPSAADETCIACLVSFKAGDEWLPDASGGAIHFACCGPERESYTNHEGDPLGPDDPIPTPLIWPVSARVARASFQRLNEWVSGAIDQAASKATSQNGGGS